VNDPFLMVVLLVSVVLLLAASGLDYFLRRAWSFQRTRLRRDTEERHRRLLDRFRRTTSYRVDLRELRDFVISLQLGTSMEETLSGALSAAAEQFKGRGDFGKRLFKHVETRLSIAPEEVIKGLAEDFSSEHLRDLAQRLEMARDGGISYERALSLTVSQLEEEIRGDLKRDIQMTPIQLTFPMIIGVFLPAVLIGMYPLISQLLSNIFNLRVGP